MTPRIPDAEQTPLLPNDATQDGAFRETPLPKLQILLLSITRLAEPLAFAVLFPFVNAMVLGTGETSVEGVGYYVGLIESMFSFTQMFFLTPWGLAADRFGRRPVLLVSLLGAAISTILFGFSTKVWQMVVARCIGGMFSGNVVLVRTLFAEFSDKTNQARAFSFFSFAYNFGILIGPVIGGILAEPSKQYPSTLGRIPLLQAYPYALPCIVSGAYILAAFFFNALFLEEPRHHERREAPPLRQLFNSMVVKALTVYGMSMLLGIAYPSILPLYAFTPVPLGGLGLPPAQIALLLALGGLGQSFWLLVLMPPLDRRYGTRRLMRACYAVWPAVFLLPIAANWAARNRSIGTAWAVIGLSQTVGAGVHIIFTSVQLVLNNVSPPAALGAINGFALTLNALIRGIATEASTSTFAYGVETGAIYLPWLVLFVLGIVGYLLSGLTPRDDAEREDSAS